MFKAIVAHDKNRLIGNGMQIPWKISEDFKHYKNTTMGHIMIMGTTTFLSIGRPLPGRTTIVLSYEKNFDAQGCEVCTDYTELLKRYKDCEETIYICGGASIYRLFLPYLEEIIVSEIKGDYTGDVFFPEYKHLFEEYKRDERELFTIIYYKRKNKTNV